MRLLYPQWRVCGSNSVFLPRLPCKVSRAACFANQPVATDSRKVLPAQSPTKTGNGEATVPFERRQVRPCTRTTVATYVRTYVRTYAKLENLVRYQHCAYKIVLVVTTAACSRKIHSIWSSSPRMCDSLAVFVADYICVEVGADGPSFTTPAQTTSTRKRCYRS